MPKNGTKIAKKLLFLEHSPLIPQKGIINSTCGIILTI